MSRTRILLVDDHEIVRHGLRTLIEAEPDLTVVGEAIDGPSAVTQAESLGPDLVIMDVRMTGMDGIEACRAIRARNPNCSVLIFTSFGTDEAVMAALLAGASGFLVKNTGRAELIRAIHALAEGHSLLDPTVTRRVTQRLVELATKAEPPEIASLSPREREVLQLIAKGDTNRQIAEHLVISEATARNHVSHVLEKLGLSRRSEAAALAARLRLDQPDQTI